MTTQPEALRLAERLLEIAKYSGSEYWDDLNEAAAELRRLHEAHDWQYKMAGERLRRIEKLEASNQELLEALKWIDSRCPTMLMDHPLHGIHKEMAHDAGACARAAIAKHGGEV